MCGLLSCYASPEIMFTGLVELKGNLARRTRRGPGYRLAVEGALGALALGESISVSGACLTVVSSDARGFEADVSLETAEKTTLGALAIGAAVNLERALKLGDRLGGHLVSGHVDAVAELLRVAPAGDAQRLSVGFPRELARFIAAKGSITLDGVSLTVNAVTDSQLSVMVIPHTLSVTTLGELRAGAAINLEVDTLARYAVRFLEVSAGNTEAGLKDALRQAGYEGAGNS
jgi:riboflavin synthase